MTIVPAVRIDAALSPFAASFLICWGSSIQPVLPALTIP
jgi:hypothetical protein